jgi:competence ComEA-like helix-hairpin-helix protein
MWKDWLTFSRGERYGLILLFLLVCFAAIFPYIYREFFFQSSQLAYTTDFYRIDSFFSSLKYEPAPSKNYFSFTEEENPKSTENELFKFDPNTVSPSELVRLGFSNRQVGVIENYRKKGGVFRTSADFAKMYVVDSELFKKLEPYIDIPPQTSLKIDTSANNSKAPFKRENIVVELNTTDTLQLVKLRGIGQGYARRIVAYRETLGGFVSIDQLKEVYGLPTELIESIRPQLTVDTMVVKKININLITYQELRKHPYLTEYQARAIIYYRETIGNVNGLVELLENKLLDAKTFNRVKSYLTVQ